jgi:serine/threonine protein kinase/WD40 repeat protein
MSDTPQSDSEVFDLLTEDFLARCRRGEQPALEEYIRQHPELADRILGLFPTLLLLEGMGVSTTAPPPPGTSALPERLGEYRIVREVGRGGMGVVYEAIQEPLGRRVALKMLPPEYAGRPHYHERFEREAQAAAKLHHTNIVPVFASGECDGTLFFAMQYIDGTSLAHLIAAHRQGVASAPDTLTAGRRSTSPGGGFPPTADEGPAPPPADRPAVAARRAATPCNLPAQDAQAVARLGLQAAEALAFAHAHGVLHRDVKPGNLLLDAQGTLWIADFGLAKSEGAGDLTESGEVLGTLRYLAPERFAGRCDARSDVYSLGVTLYELLAGRPAFAEEDRLKLMQEITQGRPARLRSVAPWVPADLETVVQKAMAAEPAERYPNAQTLADDLRRFLADEPIAARRASAAERLRRWARRNPLPAGLSAVVALLLVVLLVGALVAAWRQNQTAGQALQAEHTATDRLFDALVTRVEAGRTSGRPGQRFASLQALRQAAEIARSQGRPAEDWLTLRDEAIACLALPDLRREQEWQGNPPGTNGLALDARFERYAWSFEDEGIRVCRLEDHAELCRLPTLPSDLLSRWMQLRFSPDGRYLAAYYSQWGQHHPLEVWELAEGKGRRVLALADVAARPEFTPDGRTLVVALADGALALHNLDTGSEVRRLPPGWPAARLALQPGGSLLAVASTAKAGVQVRDLTSGKVVRELSHPLGVQGVAWHPEGRLLAAGCNDRRIHLWDALSGQEQGVLEGHRWKIHDLAFDRTGRWLMSSSWDMALRVWDLAARRPVLDLENILSLGFHAGEALRAAGVVGRRVQVWAFHPSEVLHTLHGQTRLIEVFSFSPDARWLMAVERQAQAGVRLWDVEGRREVAHFQDIATVQWARSGDGFLTLGAGGLLRWPLRPLAAQGAGAFSAGPPQPIPGPALPWKTCGAWWQPGLSRLWISEPPQDRLRLLEVGTEAHEKWSIQMPQLMFYHGSPDGRWLACGSLDGGSGVRLFDADTGRLVKELTIGDASVAFSPDGRWLYTMTGRLSRRGPECCAWRVGTWELDHALSLDRTASVPPAFAATADGRAVAVAYTQNELRLLDAATFTPFATLAPPQPGPIVCMQIAQDGSHLAAAVGPDIHLWDLRRLRQELVELGMDWDLPPLPLPPRDPMPLRLTIDPGPPRKGL